jgi:hypothetical protein
MFRILLLVLEMSIQHANALFRESDVDMRAISTVVGQLVVVGGINADVIHVIALRTKLHYTSFIIWI